MVVNSEPILNGYIIHSGPEGEWDVGSPQTEMEIIPRGRVRPRPRARAEWALGHLGRGWKWPVVGDPFSVVDGRCPCHLLVSETSAFQLIWPDEVVTCPKDDISFGYVMSENRFKGYDDLTEPAVNLRFGHLCRIGPLLASNLRTLHHRGKSYGHINFGGLHFNPGKRTTAPTWQRVLLEAEANAIVSPAGAHTIWSPRRSEWGCFKSRQPLPEARVVLRFHGSNANRPLLLVRPGAEVRKHHLDPLAVDPKDQPTTVLGEVEAHPKSPGHCILRNHTEAAWEVRSSEGKALVAEPGRALALAPGARWGIDGVSAEVLAERDLA